MRKTFVIILLGLALVAIGTISYQIRTKSGNNFDFGKDFFEGRIPLNYVSIINDISIEKSSRQGKTTILLLFNPECDACFNEIHTFSKKKNLFKEHDLILASTADSTTISGYLKKFDLDGFHSLKVGVLDPSSIGRHFIPYPTVIVYDNAGRFLKGFKGSVEVEKIVF